VRLEDGGQERPIARHEKANAMDQAGQANRYLKNRNDSLVSLQQQQELLGDVEDEDDEMEKMKESFLRRNNSSAISLQANKFRMAHQLKPQRQMDDDAQEQSSSQRSGSLNASSTSNKDARQTHQLKRMLSLMYKEKLINGTSRIFPT